MKKDKKCEVCGKQDEWMYNVDGRYFCVRHKVLAEHEQRLIELEEQARQVIEPFYIDTLLQKTTNINKI